MADPLNPEKVQSLAQQLKNAHGSTVRQIKQGIYDRHGADVVLEVVRAATRFQNPKNDQPEVYPSPH